MRSGVSAVTGNAHAVLSPVPPSNRDATGAQLARSESQGLFAESRTYRLACASSWWCSSSGARRQAVRRHRRRSHGATSPACWSSRVLPEPGLALLLAFSDRCALVCTRMADPLTAPLSSGRWASLTVPADGARHVAIRSTGAGSRCARDGVTVVTGTVRASTHATDVGVAVLNFPALARLVGLLKVEPL
jgi:hypothetical protein